MTLPPLPDPDYWSTRDDDTPLFTAAQMESYARAAIAAHVPEAAFGNIAAVPAQPVLDCEIQPRPLAYPLTDYHSAGIDGPLNYTWKDKPHRLLYDLIAAVRYYAAPQAVPVPAGWVLVPVEPTEAMLKAGLDECEPLGSLIDWDEGFGRDEMRDTYAAMLAAAPKEQPHEWRERR